MEIALLAVLKFMVSKFRVVYQLELDRTGKTGTWMDTCLYT